MRKNKKMMMVIGGILVLCFIIVGIYTMTTDSHEIKSTDQLELGQKYLDELDYEQAIVAYKAAIEIDPKCEDAYFSLAEVYVQMGNYETAADILNQGIKETNSAKMSARLEELQLTIVGGNVREKISYFDDGNHEMEDVEIEMEFFTHDKEEDTDVWDIAVNAYYDVLDIFYYKILGGGDYTEDVSYLFSWGYSPVLSLSDAGYAIMDLDGNGVPELLISPVKDAAKGMIYDLYTYVNGEAVHIASSGERYRYYLCEDNTIYFESSGGVSISSSENYTIDADNGLKLKEIVLYDGYQDENNPWFYGTEECYDEIMDCYNFDKMSHLTDEEARNIIDSYQVIAFDLALFDTYSPQGDMPDSIFLRMAFQQTVRSETEAYFICDDFDGDGTVEAFGITGTDTGYILEDVKIYYIGLDGLASCIDTKVSLYGYGGIYPSKYIDYNMVMDTGSAKFLVLGGIAGQETWLYGVRNKAAYQPKVSGQHADFSKTKAEDGLYSAEPHEGGEGYYRIYYDYDPITGEFIVQEVGEN